jgi:glycosyltransferase involved in cell wall biosynthesis
MSLSVIMTNYNHAVWLPRALTAVLRQDPPADEVIIVDDGSTDDSIAVIEAFQRRHPSIRLIRHDSNRGVVAAIETALAAASGEFLIGAAADDMVLPGLFAHAIGALRAHPQAALFCAEAVLIDRDDRILGFRPAAMPRCTSGFISPQEVRRAFRHTDNWFLGMSVVYRRERLAEIGYFDHSLGPLTDSLANRLLAARHGFFFEAKVLCAWRLYPESFSARSGLSATEGPRLIKTARRWIEDNFPADMRHSYALLAERRLRFNIARQRLVWASDKIDAAEIAALMQWGTFDQSVLRALSAMPIASSRLVLAWLAMRARPYGVGAMARSFLRNLALNRSRRRALQPLLAGTNSGVR